jgi:cytochrome P450/CRP-like cAMP-binding protein
MKAALPPLVPGLPLLGNALDLMGDPAPFLVKNYLRFGPVFRVNAAHHRLLVIAGPEANVFFMKGAGARYLENRRAFAVMKKELNGQNLIFAQDGQRHREVRQLLRPAYSREMLDRNLPIIGEALESLIRKAPVGQSIPLRLLIQRLIAELLSRAVLGRSPEKIFDNLVFFQTNLIEAWLGSFAALRVRRPRYRRAKAALFAFARQILDEHRHMTAPQGERTIADIVLAGTIHGEPLSENDLTAFTLGPILSGLDTTASTCAFLIYELLRHPELLEQIIAEIDETFNHGAPSAHELRSMRTFRGAFLETLRLHPVAPGIVRHAAEPFEFQGYRVEAGQKVLIAISVPNFLPQFYPDPERFDIERYYPPRREDRQDGVFNPWGVGPHLCLGTGQAEIIVMLAAGMLLRCTRLSLDPLNYKLRTRMEPVPAPSGCKVKISELRTVAPRGPRMERTEQIAMVLPTLDRKVLADVASRVVVRTYAAGTAIIRQGDAADRFFIVQEGELDVEVAAADGAAPRVMNHLGPGDYFGEIGLLTGSTRTATVRATRETQVMELDRDGFMTMISTSDLTSQELSRVMRQRVIANGFALVLPALDARQAASLAERVQHRHYDAGQAIVRQGEPPDAFYVLTHGACEVICRMPSGGDAVVGQLVQGDFFGEIDLLRGVPCTATVRAGPDANADVLALDAEGFRSLIHDLKLAHEEIANVMRMLRVP